MLQIHLEIVHDSRTWANLKAKWIGLKQEVRTDEKVKTSIHQVCHWRKIKKPELLFMSHFWDPVKGTLVIMCSVFSSLKAGYCPLRYPGSSDRKEGWKAMLRTSPLPVTRMLRSLLHKNPPLPSSTCLPLNSCLKDYSSEPSKWMSYPRSC